MKTSQVLVAVSFIAAVPMGYALLIWLRGLWRRLQEIRLRRVIGRFDINTGLSSPSGAKPENTVPLYEIYSNHGDQAALLSIVSEASKSIGREILSPCHKSAIEKHLSGYALNQVACRQFASHLPTGWQVHYRTNGDIAGFIDDHQQHVQLHSWANPQALQANLASNPHNCIVDSETFQYLTQTGALSKLNSEGIVVYNGHYQHRAIGAPPDGGHNDFAAHAGEFLVAGRIGFSIYDNVNQMAKGEKSFHEGGKDIAVDVGVSIGRFKAGALGLAVGGTAGAALGVLAVVAIGEYVREEWKYGKIKKLLELVGANVRFSFCSPSVRASLVEVIADTYLDYQKVRHELAAELLRSRKHERETLIYSKRYVPPTLAGALCRMRLEQLAKERNRIKAAANQTLDKIQKLGSNNRQSCGLLGEVVLANQDLFQSTISNYSEHLASYEQLKGQSPNHPYRLCDKQTRKSIESRLFLQSLCQEQYWVLGQPSSLWQQSRYYLAAISAVGIMSLIIYSQPRWWQLLPYAAPTPAIMLQAPSPDDSVERAKLEEQRRFNHMSTKQHLDAANAALDQGYDKRRRTGGDLDMAERHLQAIPGSASEHQKAQRLLRTIADRRRRAARTAGLSPPAPASGEAGAVQLPPGHLYIPKMKRSLNVASRKRPDPVAQEEPVPADPL